MEEIECPHCHALTLADAAVCSHCGSAISVLRAPTLPPPIHAQLPTAPMQVTIIAPRYGSILSEPGAFGRYFRIGIGISGWLLVMGVWYVFCYLVLKANIPASPPSADPFTPAPLPDLSRAMGIGIVLLFIQFFVFSLCLGAIIRLCRDGLHY